MPIYWSLNEVPALRGLSDDQQKTAIKSLGWDVYRHWQVWLSLLLTMTAVFAYLFALPDFAYKKPLLLLIGWPVFLSHNLIYRSYLQEHLNGYKPPLDLNSENS